MGNGTFVLWRTGIFLERLSMRSLLRGDLPQPSRWNSSLKESNKHAHEDLPRLAANLFRRL
jgi:hypothetical protein